MLVTPQECEKLIEEFEPVPSVKSRKMMSFDGKANNVCKDFGAVETGVQDSNWPQLAGFNALINSQLMDVFNPDHREVYQDMSLPLSHYWIDSSHNT